MSKHTNGTPCEFCHEMLQTAHPDLVTWFYEIREEFPTAHCAYVWRGKDIQDKLVEGGKSLLKWPHSKHNVMDGADPCSHAFDLFSQTEDGKYEANMSYLARIARFLEEKNAPIVWGGGWAHFRDGCHYQLNETYPVVNGKVVKLKAQLP